MAADASDDRIQVSYVLTLEAGERAESVARKIALEQTVELPDGCYPPEIEHAVVGRVEQVEQRPDGRWFARISYSAALVGVEVPPLLNLLFGNISMLRGITIDDVVLPPRLLRLLAGPRFGLAGIRAACGGVRHRPLVCSTAKPVGLSTVELAARCGMLARGGVDVVKDDHSVMNQDAAPFLERVTRCQEAVTHANDRTGGHTRYFPNVTAPRERLEERVALAWETGCQGVLVSPFLIGLDALRRLATMSTELILFVHPTLSGALVGREHGFAPAVLFGTLLRVLGADGVIYVNAGGRFPVSEADCVEINRRLREPLNDIRSSLPIPGGGVDAESITYWIDRYGTEVMFLLGSSLYAQRDVEGAARRLVEAMERATDV